MWLNLAKSLLPELLRSDDGELPIDERPLPHRSELPDYALRGYAGPPVVIANERYPGAYRASQFVESHVAHMNGSPGIVSRDNVDRDVRNLLELVTLTPVRVLPTIHPRP